MFRQFIAANYETKHLHKTFSDQNDCKACTLHAPGSSCGRPKHVDLAIMGTPCDPFSEQRAKRYHDGTVRHHPLYDVTFKDAMHLLTSRNSPNAVILEQVLGFNKGETRTDDSTPMTR